MMSSTEWPFTHLEYSAPPWVMRGDSLTVWYDVATDDLADRVHPSLLLSSPQTRTRARIYSIVAETTKGTFAFNEIVLACSTEHAEVAGELSYAMWTDSVQYLLWGREVFGWPLSLADVAIPDGFSFAAGDAVSYPAADLTFRLNNLGAAITTPLGALSPWITPRRRLLSRPTLVADEVLYVVPDVIDAGSRWECVADAGVSNHWPSATFVGAQLTRGFVISVGSNVEIVDR